MSDQPFNETTYLRQQVERLQRDQGERMPTKTTMTLAGIAITVVVLIVNATAFLAPIRNDVDRIARDIEQVEERFQDELNQMESETLDKDIRLSQRIDEVKVQTDRIGDEMRVSLSQIQSDINVIKTKLEQR